jgi:branched-chain amino acid transport system permease protein
VQSSLFWFTAVVVFGADSAAGAVAAAGLIVAVGIGGGSEEAALVPIGVLALMLGRLPGGVASLVRRPTLFLPFVAPPELPPRQLSARGRAVRAGLSR